MKKHRKLPGYRPLSLETLEARLPLAGDVAIKVSGGNLFVTGDDANNEINIEQQAAAGVFQVIANDGETLTLNGAPYVSGTDIPGITKNITVDLKKGDDDVQVFGQGIAGAETAANLTIKTKAGADDVTVQDANFTGAVAVDTGAGDVDFDGDDVFIVSIKAAKNLSVATGKGLDDVQVITSQTDGKASFKIGDGGGSVRLRSLE